MAKRTSRRNAEREKAWRETIARQSASGLTVREFCRREGLPEPSFYSWRRILAERDSAAARPASDANDVGQPAFVPLSLIAAPGPASSAPGGFTLELRGGRTLHLPESTSPERLAAIVRAIESEVAP